MTEGATTSTLLAAAAAALQGQYPTDPSLRILLPPAPSITATTSHEDIDLDDDGMEDDDDSSARRGLVHKWSNEDDQKLINLVNMYGTKYWNQIAARLPGRTGKQCR